MTQDDMANLLNIKRQTYSAYERGISFPDINSVSYMADFFNVSVDYILGKTDIPTVPTPEQNNEFSEALKDFSEEERHQIENYIKFIKSHQRVYFISTITCLIKWMQCITRTISLVF